MIPNFTSKVAMIEYFRGLPKNTNFAKLLFDDFNIEVPKNVAPHEIEYYWKYLVQEHINNADSDTLYKNAIVKCLNFFEEYPRVTGVLSTEGNSANIGIVQNVQASEKAVKRTNAREYIRQNSLATMDRNTAISIVMEKFSCTKRRANYWIKTA